MKLNRDEQVIKAAKEHEEKGREMSRKNEEDKGIRIREH